MGEGEVAVMDVGAPVCPGQSGKFLCCCRRPQPTVRSSLPCASVLPSCVRRPSPRRLVVAVSSRPLGVPFRVQELTLPSRLAVATVSLSPGRGDSGDLAKCPLHPVRLLTVGHVPSRAVASSPPLARCSRRAKATSPTPPWWPANESAWSIGDRSRFARPPAGGRPRPAAVSGEIPRRGNNGPGCLGLGGGCKRRVRSLEASLLSTLPLRPPFLTFSSGVGARAIVNVRLPPRSASPLSGPETTMARTRARPSRRPTGDGSDRRLLTPAFRHPGKATDATTLLGRSAPAPFRSSPRRRFPQPDGAFLNSPSPSSSRRGPRRHCRHLAHDRRAEPSPALCPGTTP